MLTDLQIRDCIADKSIVISPFDEKRLGNASYDVTIGDWYAVAPAYAGEGFLADPGKHYVIHRAAPYGSIDIPARGRVLGHTREFIGGTIGNRTCCNAILKATSNTGRLGLTVCMCAGFGDVGYINRWTLEVCNLNPFPVSVPVGAVVAQVVFFEVETPSCSYVQRGGRFQTGQSLESVRDSWCPESMLPKPIKTDL